MLVATVCAVRYLEYKCIVLLYFKLRLYTFKKIMKHEIEILRPVISALMYLCRI